MLKKPLALLGVFTLFTITPIGAYSSSHKEIDCLAKIIYHEARGEPKIGRHAVAAVTLNRAKHRQFPSTVCRVMTQPGQYSWVRRNPKIRDHKTFKQIKEETRDLYHQYRSKGSIKGLPSSYRKALFFRSSGSNPKMKYIGKIGRHKFWGLNEKSKKHF